MKNQNIFCGRFVFIIKNAETPQVLRKARSVVHWYEDQFKSCVEHTSSVVKNFWIKMTIAIADIKGFSLFSADVTQAYLQSNENLKRKVYIKSFKTFCLPEDKPLLLKKKALYFVAESEEYWDGTLMKHITVDVVMKSCTIDKALFYKCEIEKLIGMCATYVHDTLHGGN